MGYIPAVDASCGQEDLAFIYFSEKPRNGQAVPEIVPSAESEKYVWSMQGIPRGTRIWGFYHIGIPLYTTTSIERYLSTAASLYRRVSYIECFLYILISESTYIENALYRRVVIYVCICGIL